ncbi:hypothetical protein OB919_20915 [Halobacteria archaeon AArc-curdl1]|uniref:Uncharacterized protein n=1 Tax=Natronosalvus hydrolyticus TaxID=2979988 RepID=A0AAP2ZBZ5_9EURY|nr:hypothetical protein [Halobacteria archaeon AArc-curdl1]
MKDGEYSLSESRGGTARSKALLTLFCIVFSLLIIQYYSAEFWRTNQVFYLTFILYTLTALFIFTSPKPVIGLLIIIISGLINRLTAFYASERYAGVDIYGHTEQIHAVATDGSLEVFAASKYFYAPIYHIQAAQGEILFNVSTKDALALTTMMAITILPLITIFVITNHLWDVQTGLSAAFLYVISNEAINWSVHLIPTSLGVAFFTILLLAIIFYYLTHDPRYYLVFGIALALLVFTHQVSLFIAAVAAIAFGTALCMYQMQIARLAANTWLVVGLIVVLDFMTTRYSGPTGERSFFHAVLGTFVTSILSSGTQIRAEASFPRDIPYSPSGASAMADIQLIGPSLLVFLAIVGALYWFHVKRTSEGLFLGLGLGMSVFTMIVFALGGPVFGIVDLLPGRWWAFIFVVFAIFGAVGLVFVVRQSGCQLKKSSSTDTVILIIIISILVVSMVGSATASSDNPYFEQGFDAERYSITEQEVAIAEHAQTIETDDITIETDHRFGQNIGREFVSTRTVRVEYGNPDSVAAETPKIVLNRDYLSKPPANIYLIIDGDQWLVHGGVDMEDLNPRFRSVIYDNGEDELLWVVRRS